MKQRFLGSSILKLINPHIYYTYRKVKLRDLVNCNYYMNHKNEFLIIFILINWLSNGKKPILYQEETTNIWKLKDQDSKEKLIELLKSKSSKDQVQFVEKNGIDLRWA
jgi:hypothetical protein